MANLLLINGDGTAPFQVDLTYRAAEPQDLRRIHSERGEFDEKPDL
jgi:hypothetical protein